MSLLPRPASSVEMQSFRRLGKHGPSPPRKVFKRLPSRPQGDGKPEDSVAISGRLSATAAHAPSRPPSAHQLDVPSATTETEVAATRTTPSRHKPTSDSLKALDRPEVAYPTGGRFGEPDR
jgi:hypothetical protein